MRRKPLRAGEREIKERELKKQTKEYNKILPKVVSGKSVADFSVLYFYFTFIL